MSRLLDSALDATRLSDCARNDAAMAAGRSIVPPAVFSRDLHRVRLVHPRTAAEAFRDMEYGAAVEIYRAPLMARVFRFFGWR